MSKGRKKYLNLLIFQSELIMAGKKILDKDTVLQKVKRMAYEIYENNFEEKEIVFAGLIGEGYSLAKLLAENLEAISKIKTNLVKIDLDKENPYKSPVKFDQDSSIFQNKVIIVVDDVLNTGRTFSCSLAPLLSLPVKKIQSAFLVNRNFAKFPIHADYVGYELSTTFSEFISVSLSKGKIAVTIK
ncbi:MAG: Uracil phosphoribosyltransferase [Bacteroidota bacterium]